MKILLIHQYAGNKGDRAVLYATCSIIKSIDSSIHISVSTSSPELWKGYSYYQEQQIEFIPSAWDYTRITHNKKYWNIINKIKKYTFTIMRESYLSHTSSLVNRFLINPSFFGKARRADLIISIGGHHFTTILSKDLVSSINFDAMAVMSMKKKTICFSQSFGPFDFHNPRNKKLTQKLLSNCSTLYPREEQSKKSLIELGVSTSLIKETYETVIFLNSLFPFHTQPSKREKKIGIAIYSTQRRSPEKHEAYIKTFSSFCDYAVEKGYKIVFFPMELKGTPPDDRVLIKEILSRVKQPNECTYIDKDMPTHEHLQEVAKCRIFIGHKTHSTIFALASGTPLIGIAYHPKTIEFMKQFNIEQYGINDDCLTSDILKNTFDCIENELDTIGENTFKKSQSISILLSNMLKHTL
ncbi:polysaccharide pyruvyl transferase family protein [Bacteroides sp.]